MFFKSMIATLLILVSFNTYSETNDTGIVSVLHYNSKGDTAVQQRGVCVLLNPPASTINSMSSEWRCAYKTNHLYDEIHTALIMSKILNKPVTVLTTEEIKIDLVEMAN